MSVRNLIQGASAGSTPATTDPQGVDLDGALDYFSRSTDLTGNVDSKTFTFSAWVYITTASSQVIYESSDAGNTNYFRVFVASDNVRVQSTSGGVANLYIAFPSGSFCINTFNHILLSIDLANTSNRALYINDTLQSGLNAITYANSNIDFTNALHRIGANYNNSSKVKGRLSNVFLDYTYRDLSIEANRRLFIDANGKPADGWKALSPIIGMSMKDAATAHINDGTGGNFTPSGTFATSNRGANQDNCVASYFDGVADYLSKTYSSDYSTPTGTISACFKAVGTNRVYALQSYRYDTTTIDFSLNINPVDGYIRLAGYRLSDNALVVSIQYDSTISVGQTYTVSASFNTANSSFSRMVVNGVSVTPTTNTITIGETVAFPSTSAFYIGLNKTSTYTNGNIGELYFNTTYIDLATSNPFWDSVDNKPVPVRKVIADTGVTPIIAMPLDASNAGKNYGTGGDFTANSAPYVGARGASEFWARSAKFDGTTGYLSRGALTGAVDSKTFSGIFVINLVSTATNYPMLMFRNEAGSSFFHSTCSTGFNIIGYNSAGSVILNMTAGTIFTAGNTYIVDFRVDLSNTSKRGVSVNGINVSTTYSTYINDTISFTSATRPSVGARWNGSSYELFFSGNQALCYFTTDYIDFSQEVNRLKFVDAFNMPLDLASQINKGIIPNPLIYLPFSDTSNLGLNLGTGGNFTVNGTVTQGSDVNG